MYHLQEDDSAHVPPNSKQFIENTGKSDLKFLCIVEPAWRADDEILLDQVEFYVKTCGIVFNILQITVF